MDLCNVLVPGVEARYACPIDALAAAHTLRPTRARVTFPSTVTTSAAASTGSGSTVSTFVDAASASAGAASAGAATTNHGGCGKTLVGGCGEGGTSSA